ncbi:MAG: YlmC/YmxH family sporulation protein [Bacilli bacterium]|nr:YlmC/YmxH family sporulation protein [Bacilli bacterium]
MNLSDLQDKEIIDISTGRRVGSIVDVIITRKGEISKLVLEEKRVAKKIFGNNKESNTITWNKIIKIGDDIILVDCDNKID